MKKTKKRNKICNFNGKYMVVSRIDNTVIYVNVNDNYKDTVKDILKELGS